MNVELTKKDMIEVLIFALQYHLSKKSHRDRTANKHTSLGGVLDNFIVGKMIEKGVSKILNENVKSIRANKTFHINMEIEKKAKHSPDIDQITDCYNTRHPSRFVEIKYLPDSTMWLGLKVNEETKINSYIEDYNTKQPSNPISSEYLVIYASLKVEQTAGGNLNSDLLGVLLRNIVKKNKSNDLKSELEKYIDLDNQKTRFCVQIEHILSSELTSDIGIKVNNGKGTYATPFKHRPLDSELILTNKNAILAGSFQANNVRYNKIDDNTFQVNNNTYKLPCDDQKNLPDGLDNVIIQGVFFFVQKENKSPVNMIYCISDSTVQSEHFGSFQLSSDNAYSIDLKMTSLMSNDNVFIHRNKLDQIKSNGNYIASTGQQKKYVLQDIVDDLINNI